MTGVERFELPTRAIFGTGGIRCSASSSNKRKKAPAFLLRLSKMAGVERFELPTRAIFGTGGIRCSASSSNKRKKAPAFLLRLSKMAGVERFELPTRGFGIRCSASWSYTPIV